MKSNEFLDDLTTMLSFWSLFNQLPSTSPPGSSYYISNAAIIAKRIAFELEDPVRIKGSKWEPGNQLYDWYRRRHKAKIISMQLRQEQRAPFFHQYISFELNDGTYFRIDRRPHPDEQFPMNSTAAVGVEAYDTIEQITSLEDSVYNLSDCLVEVSFPDTDNLGLIIETCRHIYDDPRLPYTYNDRQTAVYTVQRFNCYFYAQTILVCTVFPRYGSSRDSRGGTNLWAPNDSKNNHVKSYNCRPAGQLSPHIRILDQTVGKAGSSGPSSTTLRNTTAMLMSWLESGHSRQVYNQTREASVADLADYLSTTIRAHSLRVAQYMFLLGCTAKEVEEDIKLSMNEIWRDTHIWSHGLLAPEFTNNDLDVLT